MKMCQIAVAVARQIARLEANRDIHAGEQDRTSLRVSHPGCSSDVRPPAIRNLARPVPIFAIISRTGGKSVNRDQSQHFPPVPAAPRPDVGQGGGSGGGSGSSYSISSSLGGGSASGGGDPTMTGRAQVVGNRQLDKLPLAAGYYDYANDGLRWGTDDDEFNFGIRAMQQIDARIYANPNQEYTSSGIFNPRTRLYFYGHLTRPLSVGKTL
jgi:hypothetical protein